MDIRNVVALPIGHRDAMQSGLGVLLCMCPPTWSVQEGAVEFATDDRITCSEILYLRIGSVSTVSTLAASNGETT